MLFFVQSHFWLSKRYREGVKSCIYVYVYIICIYLYTSYVHAVMLYYAVICLDTLITGYIIGFDVQCFLDWNYLHKLTQVGLHEKHQPDIHHWKQMVFGGFQSFKKNSQMLLANTQVVSMHRSFINIFPYQYILGPALHRQFSMDSPLWFEQPGLTKDDFLTSLGTKNTPVNWHSWLEIFHLDGSKPGKMGDFPASDMSVYREGNMKPVNRPQPWTVAQLSSQM